ncbi:3',5'-cyclic AMP phosphodiesterase CpdA [Bradyrhizobium sp. LB7.1]
MKEVQALSNSGTFSSIYDAPLISVNTATKRPHFSAPTKSVCRPATVDDPPLQSTARVRVSGRLDLSA